MCVDDVNPRLGILVGARLEPKLTLVAIKCDLKLRRLFRIEHHIATVQVEVQRYLVLLLPFHFFEVLENAIVDLNPALLPPLQQSRTVFVQVSNFLGWLTTKVFSLGK